MNYLRWRMKYRSRPSATIKLGNEIVTDEVLWIGVNGLAPDLQSVSSTHENGDMC